MIARRPAALPPTDYFLTLCCDCEMADAEFDCQLKRNRRTSEGGSSDYVTKSLTKYLCCTLCRSVHFFIFHVSIENFFLNRIRLNCYMVVKCHWRKDDQMCPCLPGKRAGLETPDLESVSHQFERNMSIYQKHNSSSIDGHH